MTSVWIGDLCEAQFIERVNRFVCRILVDEIVVKAHLHDPGRLTELLRPETTVLLREESNPHRKTRYDLVGVYTGSTLVSCDTRVPNQLVAQALLEKAIPELPDYTRVLPEYTYGDSRIDFCLDEKILIEVKGVTLVKDGHAFFPDAPTERGRKHLNTLLSASENGLEPYIFFIVQRPDAFLFHPNSETDPEFADTLQKVVKKGVTILVYTSEFVNNYIHLREKIPFEL